MDNNELKAICQGKHDVTAQQTLLPELLFNHDEKDHLDTIRRMLKSATDFTCLVAFAKSSGFKELVPHVKGRLEKGMSATFVVGLDFYQTDPWVLQILHAWTKRYDFTLYVSAPTLRNFHPKIYVFRYGDGTCRAIIGSANLTSGGLTSNCEASIIMSGTRRSLSDKVDAEIDGLLEAKEIVEPSRSLIEDYERRRDIYKAEHAVADRRARRTADAKVAQFDTLAKVLAEMKADTTYKGFTACQKRRAIARKQSITELRRIADDPNLTRRRFSQRYERLVLELWHSSGLQRGKGIIAGQSAAFQHGLNQLLQVKPSDPEHAFALLMVDFAQLNRAGTNVITEILHSIDNTRFAVMNKNSVHGMRLANITQFPRMPNKTNVSAERYGEFCAIAQQLRTELGLANLTELDSLFNYAYAERRTDEPEGDDDE